MSTLVYIRGLSGAGFRVPKVGGGFVKITENANTQVDLDDRRTQLILNGERDNFIRVASSGATTATIVGLTRYGFRIRRSSDSAYVVTKLGGGAVTVDITNGRVRRVLRRNYGRYAVAAAQTAVTIRGTQEKQNGFDVWAKETASIVGSNAGNATNGKTVTVGSKTYTLKTNLTEVQATATLTSDNTNVADGETVTVNNKTYRFKTVIAQVNDIHIGGSADASLTNLVNAINGAGTAGTDYFTGTTKPTGIASASAVTAHATTFTAAVGTGTSANAFASTETSAHLSFGAATFAGGVNPVANEVKIAGSADATLTNLSNAINASGGTPGTDYASNTTANADATASAVASHTITLTETHDGAIPLTLTTNETTYSVTGAAGGIQKVYRGVTVTVDATDSEVYTQIRRHYKSWIEG